MRLLLHIALRQLFDRRRQALTIIGGIVLGVTVLLVTTALFGGLLASFTKKILDVAPHVTMTAESAAGSQSDVLVTARTRRQLVVQLVKNVEKEERTRLRNYPSQLRTIQRDIGADISVASPYLSTQTLAAYGTNEMALLVTGVIPQREAALSDLPRYLVSGSVQRLEATRNGMLIGSKAAEDLGVSLGDRIRLVSLSGDVFNVQIVGVFKLGVEATDGGGLVNLRLAQALDHALPSEATGIGFQIRDVERAVPIADRIEKLTGRKVDTWDETNAGIITVFTFLRLLFLIVVGFVIVICGFSVANLLLTSVFEKQHDIAVMKSFGLSARSIVSVYLLQGMFVATIGCLIGCVLGAVAIVLVGRIPSGGTGGVAPLETATLQMEWNVWYFVLATVSTVVVSLIASVAPARSAAKLVPVAILRNER